MKKLAIIVLSVFVCACGDAGFDDGPSGWADVTVNSPSNNYGGPYSLGDDNVLTREIAGCAGYSPSNSNKISTDLFVSGSHVTMTVTVNNSTTHSVTVSKDDFFDIQPAMANYMCCRIKRTYSYVNGDVNLWYDSFFWDRC